MNVAHDWHDEPSCSWINKESDKLEGRILTRHICLPLVSILAWRHTHTHWQRHTGQTACWARWPLGAQQWEAMQSGWLDPWTVTSTRPSSQLCPPFYTRGMDSDKITVLVCVCMWSGWVGVGTGSDVVGMCGRDYSYSDLSVCPGRFTFLYNQQLWQTEMNSEEHKYR